MIKIIPIPAAAASATTQQLAVEVIVNLCKCTCVNSGEVLSGNINYSAGAPTVINGVAVIPITATGTIVMAGDSCNCCASRTRSFSETFDIAFTATATNTVTLTPGGAINVAYTDVKCCHTNKAKLISTLTASIS